MTPDIKGILLEENTECALVRLQSLIDETIRHGGCIDFCTSAEADSLIEALSTSDTKIRAMLWKLLEFCGPSSALQVFCTSQLAELTNPQNLREQDEAFHYLLKHSGPEEQAQMIDQGLSSPNYLVRYSAAARNLEADRLRSLMIFVDVCVERDPFDHGTYEGLTFFISKYGTPALRPYLKKKLETLTDKKKRSDVLELLDLLQ